MTQNIPLAVALQLVGSFCFAMAAHLQDKAVAREVRENQEKHSLRGSQLLASMKNPRWLAGLLLMGISLSFQITALFFAPVSVVQPVGLMAFPWSMIIQARSDKHRIPKRMASVMGVTIVATVAFTLLISFHAAPEADLQSWPVLIGALVVYVCAGTMGWIGAHGMKKWRSLAWASGGAMFYGLEASLVKSLIQYARQHEWHSDPLFWCILAALIVGSVTAGWMIQQGYATGAAELVVASMTITSPVVAVLFGIIVLGEGVNHTPIVTAAILLCAIVAIAGVILLSWLHTHVVEAEIRQAEAARARAARAARRRR